MSEYRNHSEGFASLTQFILKITPHAVPQFIYILSESVVLKWSFYVSRKGHIYIRRYLKGLKTISTPSDISGEERPPPPSRRRVEESLAPPETELHRVQI